MFADFTIDEFRLKFRQNSTIQNPSSRAELLRTNHEIMIKIYVTSVLLVDLLCCSDVCSAKILEARRRQSCCITCLMETAAGVVCNPDSHVNFIYRYLSLGGKWFWQPWLAFTSAQYLSDAILSSHGNQQISLLNVAAFARLQMFPKSIKKKSQNMDWKKFYPPLKRVAIRLSM